MSEQASLHLGANIRALRESRGITQQQLAKASGVPRATWANLESGSANPTLSVLLRVAEALGVSIPELISAPRAVYQFFAADTVRTRSRGEVNIRMLLPEPLPGIEIERMDLPAGARMVGAPHTQGTREYLTCETGQVTLTVSGQSISLGPGDVVVFRGDQRHSYHNPTTATSVAYSAVLINP